MNIDSIMSKHIICCDISSTVKDVALAMKQYDIGFIPICEKKRIIGVITDRDIVIKMLLNHEGPSSKIKNYINENIISISIDSTIEETLKKMEQYKIKRILVTSNKKVEGIISLSDILNQSNSDSKFDSILKQIYQIKPSGEHLKTEIDEFYL